MSGSVDRHSHGAAAPLKGALIGCGFFARNHLHAWRAIRHVQLAARGEGREFGIERLSTAADTLLKSEHLDFVDIATTVASHRTLVELAASAGVAVNCHR